MKILISGYYGFGNLGDEAVLLAIKQELSGHEITVLPKSRSACFKILWEIAKTDVLLSGGGTLIQNATSNRSFLYYLGIIWLAKLLRKKVVIFAQGFGPLSGKLPRALVRFVLSGIDLVMLRDKDSFDQVNKLGLGKTSVCLTADPALILNIPAADKGLRFLELEGVAGSKNLLGICVRDIALDQSKKFYEKLAKNIDWLAKKHKLSPVFILFHFPRDMEAAAKVISLMQENANIIFRQCTVDEMLSIISHFDFFIGMRLHSLIFAAMNAVPMLGIAYDPKVKSFMKSIDQPCVDFELTQVQLETMLANRNKIKETLKQKKQELRDKAALNFKLLESLCP